MSATETEKPILDEPTGDNLVTEEWLENRPNLEAMLKTISILASTAFSESTAENYLEWTMRDEDDNRFILTFRRVDGLSPGQKAQEAKQCLSLLLADLAGFVATCNHQRSTEVISEIAKRYEDNG